MNCTVCNTELAEDVTVCPNCGTSIPKNNTEHAESLWHYEKNGTRLGPCKHSEILNMINAQEITYGDMVWSDSLDTWTPVESTVFKAALNRVAPPPLAGKNVNNTWLWLLAFAPVLGLMLEILIGTIIVGPERGYYGATHGKLWFVTVILNITLCILDERSLTKAGHATTRFKGFVWLVPVYIFQRCKNINKSLVCFYVWIAMFILMLLPE